MLNYILYVFKNYSSLKVVFDLDNVAYGEL